MIYSGAPEEDSDDEDVVLQNTYTEQVPDEDSDGETAADAEAEADAVAQGKTSLHLPVLLFFLHIKKIKHCFSVAQFSSAEGPAEVPDPELVRRLVLGLRPRR